MTDLPPGAPEPAFTEPWHAQLFALTVKLSEDGHFTWPHWADKFSATLSAHGLTKELDGGDDYFTAWLVTLEAILADSGQASVSEAAAIKAAWEEAYLTTPHGAPVHLKA